MATKPKAPPSRAKPASKTPPKKTPPAAPPAKAPKPKKAAVATALSLPYFTAMVAVLTDRNSGGSQGSAYEPLTPRQLGVLLCIAQGTADQVNTLAAALNMHKPGVTRAFDRLHSDGLLVRDEDEKDRRLIHGRLTPDGIAWLKNFERALANKFSRIKTGAAVDPMPDTAEEMSHAA